jgi:hypothetical protein
MALVQTYGGTVRVISGVVPLGCCCDSCCDEIGGPPTADFSYTQTSNDPCTIDLHNESTPGTCSEELTYRWLKNGVEFSTSQNPTGVSVADGDDITLEVTDGAGCEDSAVMAIECETMHDCTTCDDDLQLPDSVALTVSGVTNGSCGTCGQLNGTFTLPWYSEVINGAPDGTRACMYEDHGAGLPGTTACLGGGGSSKDVEVGFTASYIFAYLHDDVFGRGAIYRANRSGSCRGTFVLSLYSCNDTPIGGGTPPDCNNASAICNWPATVSVTL